MGAAVQRTSISKVSDSVVRNYENMLAAIDEARSGYEFRPPVKQMIDEIFGSEKFCNRIVRPGTPLGSIPDHKLLSPSEAVSDHMLLPTMSVKDLENM